MTITTASATVETGWPMNKSNEKLHPSDIFVDFENGNGQNGKIPSVPGVSFVDHLGFSWVYMDKTYSYANIYPECWDCENAYIVNGRYGAYTSWALISHYAGVIVLEGGGTHVSILSSNGCYLTMTAYDKTGKIVDSCTARPNTGTLTFTRMTVSSNRPNIYTVEIMGSGNHWIVDDMIVGGITLPDKPVDYSDVAEKVKRLVGGTEFNVKYLEHGFGFDYRDFTYADVEDIITPPHNCPDGMNCADGLEYWNPDTKTFEYGEGISNVGLIIWAYNSITRELYGESVVKWETPPDMAKHDFTEPVPIGEEQPGDVYFLHGGEYGALDEVGIVVDEDYVVTSRPEEGVIYVFKPILENDQDGNPDPDFAGYYRLPGKITGGHNPIKKYPPTN